MTSSAAIAPRDTLPRVSSIRVIRSLQLVWRNCVQLWERGWQVWSVRTLIYIYCNWLERSPRYKLTSGRVEFANYAALVQQMRLSIGTYWCALLHMECLNEVSLLPHKETIHMRLTVHVYQHLSEVSQWSVFLRQCCCSESLLVHNLEL